ncbi:hypothetical protein HAX54_016517 [Datura stramonium]|uniref:BHLH domain-containing protein n=1 Tax=Datura stramonium TaxID=4076 RepID=A0ABS8S062_DATST|nr:hypothetical protein [Datura stramonium]
MDNSSWTEMESIYTNDYSFFNHCQMMTQFDELPFSSNDQPSHDQAAFSSTWKETTPQKKSSSSGTVSISFSNSPSVTSTDASKNYLQNLNMNEVPTSETTINFSSDSHDFEDGQRLIQALGYGDFGDNNIKKKSYSRSGLQAQDHLLAERNRRERLTQLFIGLSALIPNLKKLDKSSVLGDAINYIKQLEEQVKSLEEKGIKYSEEEPTVVVNKRARIISSNGESSSFGSENSNISTDQSFRPEIEVRASNGNVLISIYCKKQRGIIKEIFSQVEKLNLSIISTSVMPFGHTTTYITITAQVDHELSTTTAGLDDANRIRGAIMKLVNGQDSEENYVRISRSK